MDILLPLFSNTGLSGAVLASLLGIIYVLLRDRRQEHSEWIKTQAELNDTLRQLTAIIHEYKGLNH